MKQAFRKRISLFLTVIFCISLCVCLFSGCSASKRAMSGEAAFVSTTAANADAPMKLYAEDASDMAGEPVKTEAGTIDGSLYTPQDGRKMIRNAHLRVETEQYDASLQAIRNRIAETGAYLESSRTSGYSEYHSRGTVLTVRVPAEQFDNFLLAQDEFGVVIASEVGQDDVTLQYTDLEARLNTLNTKKERLTALLEKADKMEDIIQLENALAETISELESYAAQMNRLNDLISYCTVTIELSEVYRATPLETQPKTLGERIERRFRASTENLGEFLEDFTVFLLGNSPVLLLLAVLIGGAVWIWVAAARRQKRKQEAARRAAEIAQKED